MILSGPEIWGIKFLGRGVHTQQRAIPRSSAQGGSLEMTMLFASSFSALAENARTPCMLLRERYFYFTAGVNCVRRFKLPAHSLDC